MMSESVTVTVQNGQDAARPGAANKNLNFTLNTPYFRSIPGLIKIAQLILGIICMACGSPGYNAGHWFLFVAVTAFIMSLIWSLVYLLSIRETFKIPINWLLTELLNTAIYTLLYFTAFVTELAWAFWVPYIIAGVFGIFNTIAYAAGAYFLYLEYKNNQ